MRTFLKVFGLKQEDGNLNYGMALFHVFFLVICNWIVWQVHVTRPEILSLTRVFLISSAR